MVIDHQLLPIFDALLRRTKNIHVKKKMCEIVELISRVDTDMVKQSCILEPVIARYSEATIPKLQSTHLGLFVLWLWLVFIKTWGKYKPLSSLCCVLKKNSLHLLKPSLLQGITCGSRLYGSVVQSHHLSQITYGLSIGNLRCTRHLGFGKKSWCRRWFLQEDDHQFRSIPRDLKGCLRWCY